MDELTTRATEPVAAQCPIELVALGLRFQARVTTPVRWSPLKGPQIRGSFIEGLRQDLCLNPTAPTCDRCPWLANCQVAHLVAVTGDFAVPGVPVARPFTVEPPLDEGRTSGPGSAFRFGLTIFGPARASLPYVLIGARRMGELGLGHGRFELAEIRAENPLNGESELIYHAGDPVIRRPLLELNPAAVAAQAARLGQVEQLTLDFLTPTRLIEGDRLVKRLTFATLLRRITRRVTDLARLAGGQAEWLDYAALLRLAEEIEVVADETRWLDGANYSFRQQRSVPLGGLLGSITFAGELTPFLPWLLWGQICHVGKDATKGNGWYRVIPHQQPGEESPASR